MGITELHIKVYDEVSGVLAVSGEDGDKLYKKISDALSNKLNVILDFVNIEIITTAFLNAAIGQLYSEYSGEELNAKLRFEHVSSDEAPLFAKVVKRAKEYFKNKEEFENTVNKSLVDDLGK
ncbi:MAG TPA: DUF4325 domain-containing protein [Bacteroidetes bacterium]|nr:DUF4325 domain-containing protein [Bacteroidota bacterium]